MPRRGNFRKVRLPKTDVQKYESQEIPGKIRSVCNPPHGKGLGRMFAVNSGVVFFCGTAKMPKMHLDARVAGLFQEQLAIEEHFTPGCGEDILHVR